jgi:hypothetical protein
MVVAPVGCRRSPTPVAAGSRVALSAACGDFGLDADEHALRWSVVGRELLLGRRLASRV